MRRLDQKQEKKARFFSDKLFFASKTTNNRFSMIQPRGHGLFSEIKFKGDSRLAGLEQKLGFGSRPSIQGSLRGDYVVGR